MTDYITPDSYLFLTKNAGKERSMEHLPLKAILLGARLAAIESGKSKLVVVKTFDVINFEGTLIADRFIVFTPTGELKTHTNKKELNSDSDIGDYDVFYEIRPKKTPVNGKVKEQ